MRLGPPGYAGLASPCLQALVEPWTCRHYLVLAFIFWEGAARWVWVFDVPVDTRPWDT